MTRKSDDPAAPGIGADSQFFMVLDRWRRALLMAPALSAAGMRIAMLLLAHVNRDLFEASGDLLAWPGRDRLVALSGRSESSIKDALHHLLQHGVIVIDRAGGRGAKDTSRIRFNTSWLKATEGDLDSKGVLSLWPDRRLGGTRSGKGAKKDPHKGAETGPKRGRETGPEEKEEYTDPSPDNTRWRARRAGSSDFFQEDPTDTLHESSRGRNQRASASGEHRSSSPGSARRRGRAAAALDEVLNEILNDEDEV